MAFEYAGEKQRTLVRSATQAPTSEAARSPVGSRHLIIERALQLTTVATLASITLADEIAIERQLFPDVLQVTSVPALRAAEISERARRELLSLMAALDEDSIEDGLTSPLEARLSHFIAAHGTSSIAEVVFEDDRASRVAAALRLLGRVLGADSELRRRLLRAGLASSSLEIRDAAVQAAELWADPTLASVIRAHRETTPWLEQYAVQVARALEA